MKKINFKKITLGTIATVSIVAIPITTAVSCGTNFSQRNNTFENIPWNKFQTHEAIIVNWHDGDTPKVKFIGKKLNKPGVDENNVARIRIKMIDTPEIATGGHGGTPYRKTTGDEYKYAKQGKDLADKLMPAGTKVKIVTSFQKTYNRIVGNIFFDKNHDGTYESNWSVSLMNEGLAMPFISNPDEVTDERSIVHYVGIPFADAFNYAYTNKIGMFSLGENGLQNILKNHGETSIVSVLYRNDDEEMIAPNIYDYYKAWKETKK